MVLPSKVFKKVVFYLVPVEAINIHYAVLLAAYTTVVSHVGGMAVTQTLIDLQDNETSTDIIGKDIDVKSVSNAVMWSCRTEAQAKGFYKGIYLTSFILLIILGILSYLTNICRPEFWCKRTILKLKAAIGDTFLALAILLLFLSFDLSPLSCQAGYGAFEYQIFHKVYVVDLVYDVKVVNFHKAMPYLSIVFFIAWSVTNGICLVIDLYCLRDIEDIFNDMYDSDAPTEDENEDRHYEINRVLDT